VQVCFLENLIGDGGGANCDLYRGLFNLSAALYRAAADVLGYKPYAYRDWFDENNLAAIQHVHVDELHHKHLAWISDKNSVAKKASYKQARKTTQRDLRAMKDTWWANIASELQAAADTHDMRSFYHNLKQVFGPKKGGSTPIFSRDGTSLLTNQTDIMNRWM